MNALKLCLTLKELEQAKSETEINLSFIRDLHYEKMNQDACILPDGSLRIHGVYYSLDQAKQLAMWLSKLYLD